MPHFFEKRDPWGHGMALWVLVVMLFLAPLAWWSLQQIDLENDVENWLPSDDPQRVVLEWYRDQFPVPDRCLLSWDGSSLDDPRVETFAEKLEGTPDAEGTRRDGIEYVDDVITPHDLIGRMAEYDVPRDEAVRRLTGVLVGAGQLKVRLTDAGRERKDETVETLKSRIREELGVEIAASAPTEKPSRVSVGTGESDDGSATDEEGAEAEPDAEGRPPGVPVFARWREHDLQLAWPQMHMHPEQQERVRALALELRGSETNGGSEKARLIEECFFVPGEPVALAVVLSEAGSAERDVAFEAIRKAGAEVGIKGEDLRMGGRPVAGEALNQAVERVAWNADAAQPYRKSLILVSCLVSAVLSFLLLRSLRLAVLVLAVAVYTTLISLAVVPVTGGSMNMVLVVMPPLLLVLTISAAIHVANYWKHAARRDLSTSVVEAVKMAKQPCALAAITTAVGLLSLTTSPLTPVRDFGLYSAIGCVIALLMALFALPALMQFWPARSPGDAEGEHTGWQALGRLLSRHRTPVWITCVLVFAVSAYGLTWFRTEVKVIRYFPDDSRVVQDYNFLEENLSGIVPVDTVVRFGEKAQNELNFLERLELVREIENKIRAHPEISGAMSLADFQPVHEPPDTDDESLSTFQKLRATKEYNTRAQRTEEVIKSGEADASNHYVSVAEEDVRLEHAAHNGFQINKGDELWRITAQVAILSDLDYSELTGDSRKAGDLDEIARSVLKYHPGSGHVVTGMVPVFLRTQRAVLESLIKSFALAFGVIAVVMMILLRNPLAGLLTMLPNLLPVGVVFGLISWNGLFVDIGTMITASVALGIAVDGTLHLLTWFRHGLRQGLSQSESVAQGLSHCGPAMFQTSLVVGIGLLVLAQADLLLVSRFGWLMASLIGAALVADVIFLPALLAGPLGYVIRRTIAASSQADSTQSAESTEPEGTKTATPHLDSVPENSGRRIRVDS